eukprot:841250_1
MGGLTQSGANSNRMYKYNVCSDVVEDRDTLPIANGMSLFSVFIGDGFLCIFGGVTTDDSYNEYPVNKMYCSLINASVSRETHYPTHTPTGNPTTTIYPTMSPTNVSTEIVSMNDWEFFHYRYKKARSAQICVSDSQHAFFFGGVEWSLNGDQYSKELTEFIALSTD